MSNPSKIRSAPIDPGALQDGSCRSLQEIAEAFALPAAVAAITPLGQGNVNDTYRVSCSSGAGQASQFVLQRLNTGVFARPDWVMANLARLSDHAAGRPWPQPERPRRWELPQLLPTRDGGTWLRQGPDCWRMLSFVADTTSPDTVLSDAHAAEVGRALGGFHRLVHDLPCDQLHDTLEGFHVTPGYLHSYDQLLEQGAAGGGAGGGNPEAEAWCHRFIAERRPLAPVLEQARSSGRLQPQPIHGDPKVNNVLLDSTSGQAVALVDLDTVKPGLLHYDIGDALRSGCNPAGEETTHLASVQFDPGRCRAMLTGYLELARPILSAADLELIPTAARLLSFELGLRFFSDHLAGNRYFKCRQPGHNLERALVQFTLTERIEAEEGELEQMVRELST
jgi:Ser/Thr protein kinase RdoA (MazF antagonist)